MKNCKKCKHKNATFNIDKLYMCDLTNDFIEHPWIKPWICNNYEKENNDICTKNICCKQCDNKCSNHCCKEAKEEK